MRRFIHPDHAERTREGKAIKLALWNARRGPVPAKGKFPYPHRTVAEVDKAEASK